MTNLRVETAALQYKILVLGNTQVGKSSIIRRYTTGQFPHGMLATIGEFILFLCSSQYYLWYVLVVQSSHPS